MYKLYLSYIYEYSFYQIFELKYIKTNLIYYKHV